MRRWLRWRYLWQAPQLLGDVLLRGQRDYTFDLMPMSLRGMGLKKRINFLRSGMNLFFRRLRPWAWPLCLQIELTNACNLRCPICPTGAGVMQRPRQAMSLELYRRLLAEVGPYALSTCLWGWGEPMLYPHFAEACRIARSHGVLPMISTNGQNLDDPRIVAGLLDDPPEYLIVALDGMTERTNALYRVGARLEPILGGVRRLADLKRRRGQSRPFLHMRLIVMNHNEHELPELPAFAAENGFDLLTLRTLSVRPGVGHAEHTARLPSNPSYRAFEYRDGRRVTRDDFICQHAFNYPMVLCDGTVVPCDQFFDGQQPYGRLDSRTTFGKIWFGRQAADVRRQIRRDRRQAPICDGCTFADRPANTCSVEAHILNPQVASPGDTPLRLA